ncbi:MAG: diguanylate cyclase, partial [Sulfurovum sp.]
GLILYDNTMNGVIQYAKKIRQYIEDKNIEHKSSPLGYVTVSIGVSIRKMDDTRYALYQCADNALYVAKKLGRNKIFFSEC